MYEEATKNPYAVDQLLQLLIALTYPILGAQLHEWRAHRTLSRERHRKATCYEHKTGQITQSPLSAVPRV